MSKNKKKKGIIREYGEALLFAGLVALSVRAFVIEAFKIPSGSMIPSLSIGDHIFVNKFVYGVRIPFTKTRIIQGRLPERGEVVVFMYPHDESVNYIKRVVGLPGDVIHIEADQLTVNGKTPKRANLEVELNKDNKRLLTVHNGSSRRIPFVRGWQDFAFFEEQQGDNSYLIQYEKYAHREKYDIVVPAGQLFVMGDNRDRSRDSREWGFVPLENVKGQAMFVWLSLDRDQGGIRWNEFGRWVK